MKLKPGSASIKGKAPKAGKTSQVMVTSKKPSRGCSSRLKRRVARLMARPDKAVTPMASKKGPSAASCSLSAKAKGTPINNANSTTMRPTRATTAAIPIG